MNLKIGDLIEENFDLPFSDNDLIEKYFYQKNALGKEFIGIPGFNLGNFSENDKKNLIDEFKSIEILKSKNIFGLIDLTIKLKDKFGEQKNIDKVFVLEPYNFNNLGKTRFGYLLHDAKGNSDIKAIKYFSEIIYNFFVELDKKYNFDFIGFAAPTLKGRKIQIMEFMRDYFLIKNENLKILNISKIDSMPSQKSLSKFSDRMENAKNSFYIGEKNQDLGNILIIDDAIGSGNTINFLSEKIKNTNKISQIIGLGIVGSLKGFDIIKEI